jgi:CubicO group peptidase (beta-lactamase class C family)
VLAEIVRRISGMPLRQFAKERIFGPLEKNSGLFIRYMSKRGI